MQLAAAWPLMCLVKYENWVACLVALLLTHLDPFNLFRFIFLILVYARLMETC